MGEGRGGSHCHSCPSFLCCLSRSSSPDVRLDTREARPSERCGPWNGRPLRELGAFLAPHPVMVPPVPGTTGPAELTSGERQWGLRFLGSPESTGLAFPLCREDRPSSMLPLCGVGG